MRFSVIDEIWHDGGPPAATPHRRGAIAFAMKNPYAGRYVEDIAAMMDALKPVGLDMAHALIVALGGDAKKIEAYGKGAIVGVAGEVRGSYKTISIAGDQPKVRVYTFMAGPRARPSHSRVAPFGQVLFGAARASTSVLSVIDTVTNFAYQPGGGVDLKVSGGLGVRLEADYRIIRSEGKNSKEPAFVIAALFSF